MKSGRRRALVSGDIVMYDLSGKFKFSVLHRFEWGFTTLLMLGMLSMLHGTDILLH